MKELLNKLCLGTDLTEMEAQSAMASIMDGEATPAQVAAFLVALKMKGETAGEIYGCAKAMRQRSQKVQSGRANLTDTCGTGGDGRGTFNISTAAALIAAGAGLAVAKHGNRSVSSKCGSADVLEALGVTLELTPKQMGLCLDEIGIAFLYAPVLHQAMKHAAGPRKEVGVRSVFNLLGPLTNPAGAKRQVMGVYAPQLAEVMANVLNLLGAKRALVVHGSDGSDELTLAGSTLVCELKEGRVSKRELTPENVGLNRSAPDALSGGGPQENARLILEVLEGKPGPYRDVAVLNAAAALYVGEQAEDLSDGVQMAQKAIDSGAAMEKLQALQRFTGGNNNALANCS
ncbi:anthranilate phosphoribosyltransferase [Dethiobacter alkaliphilus]|uniref:Anthranilate phosphoribosyltransferase n=1 Tax=Dethiobacter alkaliphilus AHT 1 TaxID=555088 RepID=C0GDK8_DETAL|nr:anthranilate phosphoribosyltransferase [Dethiobacter alkaliphilus]EEG78491.1 anthranilate phosphoribosyltransferase [Dethiobacter alkaliphilus AHT 1]